MDNNKNCNYVDERCFSINIISTFDVVKNVARAKTASIILVCMKFTENRCNAMCAIVALQGFHMKFTYVSFFSAFMIPSWFWCSFISLCYYYYFFAHVSRSDIKLCCNRPVYIQISAFMCKRLTCAPIKIVVHETTMKLLRGHKIKIGLCQTSLKTDKFYHKPTTHLVDHFCQIILLFEFNEMNTRVFISSDRFHSVDVSFLFEWINMWSDMKIYFRDGYRSKWQTI